MALTMNFHKNQSFITGVLQASVTYVKGSLKQSFAHNLWRRGQFILPHIMRKPRIFFSNFL